MRNHRRVSLVALAFCATQLLAGCKDEPPKNPNNTSSASSSSGGGAGGVGGFGGSGGSGGIEKVTGANFALTAIEEIKNIEFIITRVSCAGEQIIPYTKIDSIDVSNANGGVVVDHFVLLEPGCYDVFVQPYDANGVASTNCEAGLVDQLLVLDGETTETGILLQCQGKKVGALDLWVVLNGPPWISDVVYNPSKLAPWCNERTICVEFTEPDGAPVEIEWYQRSGATLAAGPTPGPMQFDPVTKKSTQCATLTHSGPGTVGLEVIAFDMITLADGSQQRAETYFASKGLSVQSRDSLKFPSHGEVSGGCSCTPVTEICDMYDNDCDGQNNENLGCACLPFSPPAFCYTGPAGTAGVGECRIGGQPCKMDGSGHETTCQDQVLPKIEQCNGRDDDCDGQTDEGFTNCNPLCVIPSVRDCAYTGPAGTENVGACHAGSQVCVSGNTWSGCTGAVLPTAEVPGNSIDEDCDGIIAVVGGSEICNGVDDDQDGQIDEGLGTSSCGMGACVNTVQNCVNGQTQSCVSLAPSPEVCNNIDDDCDGQTDELLGSTPCGVGACQTTVQNCVNGQAQTCTPLPPPSSEICNNGIDDNCNGQMDDGCICVNGAVQSCYSGAPTTQNVGVCHGGTQLCQGGQWGPCNGEVVPASDEVCGDGFDNDCDGQSDENPPCPPTPPASDACLASCIGTPNAICESGENSFNCAQDCACGDGICSNSETPENCHVDCKFSADLNGMCGNGHCDPWEVNYGSATIYCQQDCWDGVVLVGATCGNGTCTPQENSTNCPADCGNFTASVNGNGTCETDEEHWSTSVDCSPHIDAGTILKAECQGYALVETYADGTGGTTSHTVTTCSESCGAAPWKTLTANVTWPSMSSTSFDNVQVLRPDCTICKLTNPPPSNIVGDVGAFGVGWVDVYQQKTYEMEVDPNKCNLATYTYNPGSPLSYYVVPLEWEKVSEKGCTPQAPCDVRDCAGNQYPQDYGTVGTWKPAYGSWSMFEAYCQ